MDGFIVEEVVNMNENGLVAGIATFASVGAWIINVLIVCALLWLGSGMMLFCLSDPFTYLIFLNVGMFCAFGIAAHRKAKKSDFMLVLLLSVAPTLIFIAEVEVFSKLFIH